jgi:hypothetical protein
MSGIDSPEMIERMRQREEGVMSARAAELALIRSVADDVVTRVMKEGEATHAVGEWRSLDDGGHLDHVKAHLAKWEWHGGGLGMMDIEHAIVRLLFIVAKQAGK